MPDDDVVNEQNVICVGVAAIGRDLNSRGQVVAVFKDVLHKRRPVRIDVLTATKDRRVCVSGGNAVVGDDNIL